jgi:hypothetical protein
MENRNRHSLACAGGRLGGVVGKYGPDSPEAAAARFEVELIKTEQAVSRLRELASTPEQLDQLRRLVTA